MDFTARQKWMMSRANARLNISEGAVRSGKSVGTDVKFIQQVPLASTKGDILIIGKTLDSLKRNVINPILEYLGNDAMYFPGKRELHFWDRICYAIGANDDRAEGKIRGSTVSLAYGDEVTLWPEGFFKMLDSRLSLKDSRGYFTTNPDNPNHWLMTDYLDRSADLDLLRFHFDLDHNLKFLDPSYVKNIKLNYIGLWYKRFILGLWCAAEGAIYDFFDEDEHVLTKTPKADYYDVGVDYGTGNPTVFMLLGNSFRNVKPHIWAEKEYYYDSKKKERQKTDKQYADDFIDFMAPVTASLDPVIESLYGMEVMLQTRSNRVKACPLHNIYIDPSAASFKLQLKQYGVTGLKDAKNDVLDGIRTVSRMLQNRQFAICQCCTYLIKEAYAYVWDKKKQDIGIDAPKKTNDHCWDATRYPIFTKYGESHIDLEKMTKM